jgi:hypothetical protein
MNNRTSIPAGWTSTDKMTADLLRDYTGKYHADIGLNSYQSATLLNQEWLIKWDAKRGW